MVILLQLKRYCRSNFKLICFTAVGYLIGLSGYAQSIPVPKNYTAIDSVRGDLDLDGKDELVVAYNTRASNGDRQNENIPRELRIFKKQGAAWQVWKVSSQVLLGSNEGGMMGDPFGELKIEKGTLLISHNGGSSWKWANTDQYRYQNNEFYLIGYKSTYGKPCEYWGDVDFNLSTGKLVVKKEYEDCKKTNQEIYKRENEVLSRKGLKITLQKRNAKELKIITPKYKHEVYLTVQGE